jgi:hypothetical protein
MTGGNQVLPKREEQKQNKTKLSIKNRFTITKAQTTTRMCGAKK